MDSSDTTEMDHVSVVLAVRDEIDILEKVIESLLQQESDGFKLDLIIVDGGSSDGSRELAGILCNEHANLTVIDNTAKTTPHAFNLGVHNCGGNYVAILGAHAIYSANYISVCLSELKARKAVGASGRVIVRPVSSTTVASLICWMLGHPFGTSSRSFRNHPEGYAHTLPYAVFDKKAIVDIGGYDESLARNQDNDLNQRLLDAGHKLFYSWKTEAYYCPRSTLRGIHQYAFNTGFWNIVSLEHDTSSMRWYHLAPFVFVAVLLFLVLLHIPMTLAQYLFNPGSELNGLLGSAFITLAMLIVVTHLAAGFLASAQIFLRKRSMYIWLLPALFLSFHLAYGLGSLKAVLCRVRLEMLNIRAKAEK